MFRQCCQENPRAVFATDALAMPLIPTGRSGKAVRESFTPISNGAAPDAKHGHGIMRRKCCRFVIRDEQDRFARLEIGKTEPDLVVHGQLREMIKMLVSVVSGVPHRKGEQTKGCRLRDGSQATQIGTHLADLLIGIS